MLKNQFVQTCDSRKCAKIEKEENGKKYIPTTVHNYLPETEEFECTICGKKTKLSQA